MSLAFEDKNHLSNHMLANVFLSAIFTKATVNKTGTVTANTLRIDIMVGKYNILNLKE